MTNLDDMVKDVVRYIESAVLAGKGWKEELDKWGKYTFQNKRIVVNAYATTIAAAVVRAVALRDKFNVYVVGGCVRDAIMGKTPQDYDYVVCGATAKEMIEHGFKRVDCSFPVFIHPVTGDEWALARTERKGKGSASYHNFVVDFDPSTTIEEDLGRRDLTMNAIARCLKTGELIDPFNGRDSINSFEIRAVSEASFVEDPLRVIRALRFAARYDFEINVDTFQSILKVTNGTDLEAIPDERHVAEFRKVLKDAVDNKDLSIVTSYFIWCVDAGIDKTKTFSGALMGSSKNFYDKFTKIDDKLAALQDLWDNGVISLTQNDIFNLVLAFIFSDAGENQVLPHRVLSQYADARTYARLFAIDKDKVTEFDTYWNVVKVMKPWHDCNSPLIRFGDLYISAHSGHLSTFFEELADKLSGVTSDDLMKAGITGPELGKHLEARRKDIFIDHMIASM